MAALSSLETICDEIAATLEPLSARSAALVVCLAAYRVSWVSQGVARLKGTEWKLQILAVLDQNFDDIVAGASLAEEAAGARFDLLLELTSHSEDGAEAAAALPFSILIDEALQLFRDEEPAGHRRMVGIVDHYLSVWTSNVGWKLFRRRAMGGINMHFYRHFYDMVLADRRCVRAVDALRNDIGAVGAAGDFRSIAHDLRERARSDSDAFLALFG